LTGIKFRFTLLWEFAKCRFQQEGSMSNQAHLDALKAKHKVFEAKLADALAHPSSSDAEINSIKHEKLKLKDEIAQLEVQLKSLTQN
jgi:hypothetical protein